VATPPPTPAAAPRRVTSAPAPVARVKPISVEPTARPAAAPAQPEPDQGPKVPAGAIAAGAVAAAVIAFVIGMSGGGGASVASATGDGFVLKAPSGWKAAPAAPALRGALGAKAVALAPPGAAAGEGISAGTTGTDEAAALTRGTAPARVKLAAGEAGSYADVRGIPTLYVLPTDAGALVVACSAAPAVKDACAKVAGSVELTRGTAQPPGPTGDGARAVGGALTRLRDGVRNPTQDLNGAGSRSAQALAATDLSRAYRAAAGDVAGAPVGALAMPARDALAAALKGVASAWASFARAAPSGSVGAARSAVSRARARVTAARAALAAAGYPQGGG
jgi:hypothetical protein